MLIVALVLVVFLSVLSYGQRIALTVRYGAFRQQDLMASIQLPPPLETDRQIDRQADRQTGRQPDRQIARERERERQTDRQTDR